MFMSTEETTGAAMDASPNGYNIEYFGFLLALGFEADTETVSLSGGKLRRKRTILNTYKHCTYSHSTCYKAAEFNVPLSTIIQTLEQTEAQLIINIIAPYTNVKDTEIHVNEDDFRFFSTPYYLRLNLPGKVEETDNSSAKYLVDSNSFVVTLDKMTSGEFFEGLDMLTTMLQPRTVKKSKPLIEVLSSETNEDAEDEEDEDDDYEFDENAWMTEQKMEEETPSEALLQKYHYGFANLHTGLKENYEVELREIAMIRNPDSMPPSARRQSREEAEAKQFSDDQYLYDLMENHEVDRITDFEAKWEKFSPKFTDEEKELMRKLKNQKFKLDVATEKHLMLGLFDLIFSYNYDLKVNEGKHCVESAWNISRLSATLSWFDIFETVEEVVRSVMRRSLCYPLYRNWNLSLRVLKHTVWVFKQGQIAILKCLLSTHRIFSKRSPYYLLNQLYIDQYCTWIQFKADSDFHTLISAFEKATNRLTKNDVNLDLIELETAAMIVEDEEMNEDVTSQIKKISV
ncbi:unnamed protein product [Allacma fusca]|uniref:Protein SHQ1 homolog n=1 Tax=Allacma fusca TaxID=39272 RepID=A0A8J2P7N0_9HEXA|nr:unnamed protein product [Allacma fusca]